MLSLTVRKLLTDIYNKQLQNLKAYKQTCLSKDYLLDKKMLIFTF